MICHFWYYLFWNDLWFGVLFYVKIIFNFGMCAGQNVLAALANKAEGGSEAGAQGETEGKGEVSCNGCEVEGGSISSSEC